uniref:RF_PROK_I domain-containing protein n=1 Tax=Parastrongyloides trichosuri TaxID=131310 RepID=A0A0N4Z2B2_PARTI
MLPSLLKRFNSSIILRSISSKQKLKDYEFPIITADDCEMKFISGWGPGGQKVNTAQNAVYLKHKKTGLSVKVHESRLLPKNIDIAYERLKHVLDRHINGDNCYDAQLEKLEKEREERNKKQREKKRNLKKMLHENDQ